MAYKVFSNGDALTGSELNTYLMNQSVISFATTTARDAALPSPSEGQLVWLEDSNKYAYYSGSAWSDLIPATPTFPSGNAIINGAFDIWQRGTSFSSSGYTADRWRIVWDGTGTRSISQQTFTPGAAPVAGYESQFFFRYQQATAGSGASYSVLQTKIEDVRTFAGQSVTISFWAKSASASTLSVAIEQDFGSGGSTRVDTVALGTTATTTEWVRYSATVTLPSISGKTIGTGSSVGVAIFLPINTTFTTDFWGVQLEAGSTATAFKRNASNIQGELAACQRYYYADVSGNPTGSGDNTGTRGSIAPSTTFLAANVKYPVPMRTTPTIYVYGNGGSSNVVRRTDNGSTVTLSGNNYGRQQNTGFSFISVSSGVFTANAGYDFQIAVDAEL